MRDLTAIALLTACTGCSVDYGQLRGSGRPSSSADARSEAGVAEASGAEIGDAAMGSASGATQAENEAGAESHDQAAVGPGSDGATMPPTDGPGDPSVDVADAAPLPNGAACTIAAQCASGRCTSKGRCCGSGPNSEICNGKDDDCDGVIDDVGCLFPVVQREGHAYMFVTDKTSWTAARALCASYGYHLVTVETEGENSFITTQAAPRADDWAWWIGLNDRQTESVWVWEDGTPLVFRNWGPGEPNSFGDGEEDCVNFWTNPARPVGRWNDWGCETKDSAPGAAAMFPSVCEAP